MTDNQPIALVTGSTSGIGKATAHELAKQGVFVILNSHTEHSSAVSEFAPDSIDYLQADISVKADVERLASEVESKYSRLDFLVANAGIMPLPCGIDTITEENIEKTIKTNLIGTFWTLKYLGKLIQNTSTQGSIVTLTSVDGIIGEPYGVMYSATKAGIISLTKSFARQYKNPLVRVNGIAPGLIDTPLSDSTGEDPSWTTDVSIIQRVGKPEEIAKSVAFLLSNESSYTTGQILAVDGGFTLK
jgi:NAD(P)-dependent dehydrogenase (short-subunit alcohol dehydrogenase family)